MGVYIVSGGGKPFTIRDVVQLSVQTDPDRDELSIIAGGNKHALTLQELRALAEEGTIPFRALFVAKGIAVPEQATVRLVADDGYTREVPAASFLEGDLLLNDRRCRFPALPSRDQVSLLKRIEIP